MARGVSAGVIAAPIRRAAATTGAFARPPARRAAPPELRTRQRRDAGGHFGRYGRRAGALNVEVDADLFAVPDPRTGRADFFPYSAAHQKSALDRQRGRRDGDHTATAISWSGPVLLTPTLMRAWQASCGLDGLCEGDGTASGEQVAHERAHLSEKSVSKTFPLSPIMHTSVCGLVVFVRST